MRKKEENRMMKRFGAFGVLGLLFGSMFFWDTSIYFPDNIWLHIISELLGFAMMWLKGTALVVGSYFIIREATKSG